MNEQRLQQLVDAEVAGQSPSCILRVENPLTKFVWQGAAGTISRSDATTVSPTESFRIASVTKTFTAAVVMQLVCEGRLRLDDLMISHLDGSMAGLVDAMHVFKGRSYGREITVRQLLRHSSGLFDYASASEFFALLGSNPSKVWTPRELVEIAVTAGSPWFAPDQGYGYAYSDTGYVLLGLVIEQLDQRPLHESYRQRILMPLELNETYLEGYEEHRGPRLTHAYEGDLDAMAIHGSADWAGGGLVSTAVDLATFVAALVRGDVVLRSALDEMFSYDFRTLDPERHTLGYVGYGLGVDARQSNGLELRGHRGHWGVLMHIEPSSGLVITGTINQASYRPDALMHGVTEMASTQGRQ